MMQNRKRNKHNYSVYLCMVFMLFFGAMFTACVEEQKLAEQIQETTDETEQEPGRSCCCITGTSRLCCWI